VTVVWLSEQSAAGASTKKKQLSRLASSGPTDDMYTRLKLGFAIDSIQMELFTGDRSVVSVVTIILVYCLIY